MIPERFRLFLGRTRPLAFLTLAIGAFLSGCAVQTDEGILAGPALTLGTSKTTEAEVPADEKTLPTTIAVLPLGNQTTSDLAIAAVRQTLSNHFSSRNYRVMHTADVDRRLALAGIDIATEPDLDFSKLRTILGVDGLITGNVTHYEKTFAGVGARISVGVSLTLLNDQDEVVWEASNVQRSYAGGVSVSPVGIIVNALAAAKHLYGDVNLFRAADDLGRILAKDMPAPERLAVKNRPVIQSVAHSGASQKLNYGATVNFALEGDAGLKASIAIQGVGLIDLQEVSPGAYSGQWVVDQSINIESETVVGRLMNDAGEFSSWVSPYGLMTIDNTPPTALTDITITSRPGAVQISWSPDYDGDLQTVSVQVQGRETWQRVAPIDQALTLTELSDFAPTQIQIMLEDDAGNQAAPQKMTVIAAPDPRFSQAKDIKSALPSVVQGAMRLRKAFGPFTLSGPLRVATDGVLLIEPGVQLELAPNAQIDVLGEIQAMGTTAAPITVTHQQGVSAQTFLILRSMLPSRVAGMSIQHVNVPFQILAGSPVIEDTVVNGAFNAIMMSGSSKPLIRNNAFTNASASAMVLSEQAQPSLLGNQFIENQPFHIQNSSSYAIKVTGNTFDPPASMMTILGPVED
jgi:hypothetical protein